MKKTLFLSLLLCAVLLRAGDPKAAFDVREPALAKSETGVPFFGWKTKQPVSEFTVLPGFYLTWGTVNGKSAMVWDDKMPLLFGHPYAKTSYAVVSVDGAWKKLNELFPPESTNVIARTDSMITLRNSGNALGSVTAVYQLMNSGSVLRCTFRIVNATAASHSLGFGHVLDAALGERGDAVLSVGGTVMPNDTVIGGNTVAMAERSGSTAGLRTTLSFPATVPSIIAVKNWSDPLSEAPPASATTLRRLYDATLRAYWNPVTVASKETLICTFDLTVVPPVFSTVFTRWDIPRFLAIDDGTMRPVAFTSIVTAVNPTAQTQSLTAAFNGNNYFTSGVASKDTVLAANSAGALLFPLSTHEIYEDVVVDLSILTSVGGNPADTLIVPVFIPKTPVSDTGLVVTIDSLITNATPKVSVIFEAERKATGQKFYSLTADNIFLSENDTRVRNFTLQKDTSGGANALDLIFVLDVTGSMGGTIDGVKNNIIEFADSLKKRGIDYRLGMVTFLDIIENIYPFTTDAVAFQKTVAAQFAHGGGDAPENSLDALYAASQYPFRDKANRVIIWITDITYHENNGVTPRTKQPVVNALLAADVTVHAVGPTAFQTDWYNPIILPTGGNFFDIYGNFRDILLSISRMKSSNRFLLTYTSPGSVPGSRTVKLELHAAGLGGTATANYLAPGAEPAPVPLVCYPNPFNPQTTIRFQLPSEGAVRISIYDLLGKLTRQFTLPASGAMRDVVWDATDDNGRTVGSGVYLVRAEVLSPGGIRTAAGTAKLLYLK